MYINERASVDATIGWTRRRRASAIVLAVCALAILAQPQLANAATTATPAESATACQISTLPVPAAAWRSDALGGDPTGRYLIGEAAVSTGAESRIVPLLWVDGRLVDLQTPYESAAYVDVNASGMILGRADDAGRSFAWLYRDGRFTLLPGVQSDRRHLPVCVEPSR